MRTQTALPGGVGACIHGAPDWLATPWQAVGDHDAVCQDVARDVMRALAEDGTQALVYFPVALAKVPGSPGQEFDLLRTIERTRTVCDQALRPLRQHGFGRLVLVAPSFPILFPEWSQGWEFSSWLSGYTRGLALEVAAHGVTVNAVLIGTEYDGESDESRMSEELQHSIRLFLDKDASYLTGQVMHLCGGKSMVSVFSY